MDQLQELKEIIEKLRTRLHDKAQSKCFTDPEVVKASQELNRMLNEYERLVSQKCRRDE